MFFLLRVHIENKKNNFFFIFFPGGVRGDGWSGWS